MFLLQGWKGLQVQVLRQGKRRAPVVRLRRFNGVHHLFTSSQLWKRKYEKLCFKRGIYVFGAQCS